MTSEALITAVTSLPSVRPSSRTASTVIEATRRTPFASSSTLAIAAPVLILVILAGIWLRALSFMTHSSCPIKMPTGDAIVRNQKIHDRAMPGAPFRYGCRSPIVTTCGGDHARAAARCRLCRARGSDGAGHGGLRRDHASDGPG